MIWTGLGAVLFAGLVAGASETSLPLVDTMAVDPQRVSVGEAAVVALPALPAKRGKVVVLRFGAVALAQRPAGCNYNASVKINDAYVTRHTPSGDERLIGREPMFRFSYGQYKGEFPVFGGPRLMILFAPDVKTADGMTTDGLGGTFVLNVSDLVRGVDGNTLEIANTRQAPAGDPEKDLVVTDIEIGWLDKALLPKPASLVPQRGPIAEGTAVDGLRLLQAKGGGFAVRSADGLELRVETGMGMKADAPSALIADDRPADARYEKHGTGYRVTAAWDTTTLVRTIRVRDGLVDWKERWTNTGEKIIGVPFRHRVFLHGETAALRLGGDTDVDALVSSATNPTVFVASRTRPGAGFGITAESDWLRLLVWLRSKGGVGEIYSKTLALAPGASIDFALTITPVAKDGYWAFINTVRRRWGVNGFTVPRPIFWSWYRAPDCETAEERFRKSLGHLGPIYLAWGHWARLQPDATVVRTGRYPKLAEGAPRAPGKCPDLDVDAFLTWEHRQAFREKRAKDYQTLRRVCPNVKVMPLMHPAMEVAYVPLADRWPYAEDVIRTAAGEPFFAFHYSKAWLHATVNRDWHVYYYSPRPGSAYLAQIMRVLRRTLDSGDVDGIYCDEFSWAGRRRTYSRYDYSRWDGYSADLDTEGNVARLKCDNGAVTESCQLQIAGEVLRRGKFFLGNGGAALRSVNELPIARFIEGGNGFGAMANGHLSTVPLVLGNFGDRRTRKGVFEAVKTCLSNGCVYSPSAVNLLLEGPDNFVCKLYPIAIRRIGPGCVEGEERLITTHSGSYRWPNRAATVRLCRYNANGNLVDKGATADVAPGTPLVLNVPEAGLVIAEIVEAGAPVPSRGKSEIAPPN